MGKVMIHRLHQSFGVDRNPMALWKSLEIMIWPRGHITFIIIESYITILYIYLYNHIIIYIWVNYNNSLTWIVRPSKGMISPTSVAPGGTRWTLPMELLDSRHSPPMTAPAPGPNHVKTLTIRGFDDGFHTSKFLEDSWNLCSCCCCFSGGFLLYPHF